jgi:hypothetical protein
VIFGALNLTESGSPIMDLEFAKSNQEKFTLHSLGSPMIMEGLMEVSPISRDVCFLKGSPIANHPAAKIRDTLDCPILSRSVWEKGTATPQYVLAGPAQKGHQSA